MTILNYTFNLLEEAHKKEHKEKVAAKKDKKNKDETTEQFHERIRYNKWKREMVKKNIIRIGFPKQFFGPHEQAEKDIVQKQKELQHKQAADMAKQQHDLNVLKATPKAPTPPKLTPTKVTPSKPTSPNLVGTKNATDNVNTKIVTKTKQASVKAMTPKENQKLFKMSKGMEKNLKDKKAYKCTSCGFPIIKYRGRYPKKCPGCSKDLVRS
jgi:hypothetical protein